MKSNIGKLALGLTLTCLVGACSTQDRARQGSVATDAAAAVSKPSDAEIAYVVTTVNNSEIEAAQLAKKKSANSEVRRFANHMIKDHTAMNKEVQALSEQLGAAVDKSAISTSLTAGSAATMSSLKDLKGSKFDRAYIDQQVQMHQSVWETMDQNLIPNAQNEKLKALLGTGKETVAKHLEHAKKIQAKLGGGTTTPTTATP